MATRPDAGAVANREYRSDHEGFLRALAVPTIQRSRLLPEVPTVAESGVPGFDVPGWYAVVVPRGTPEPAIARLNAAMRVALDDAEVTATLNRKVSRGEALSAEDSERIVGMSKLIGQVQTMVEQSGAPEGFDAAKWVAGWLQTPVAALGGGRPVDYMDTMEGQGMVSVLLARMQSGAYA